jgi:Ca2+-transporting ATPase
MGCLSGFIVTFLGASIFNLLGGVPFIPLQTLYVNFTTQVFEAVGLGYGKPSGDLMERKPRKTDEPILDRPSLLWLSFFGFVIGVTTLLVIDWGNENHGAAIAHTMGLTAFSLANVYYAICCKDDRNTVFSLDTFDDHRFVLTTGMSFAAIVLGTQLGLFNRLLDTVGLNVHQWLICILAPLTIVIASEIRKLLVRRREPEAESESTVATVEAAA